MSARARVARTAPTSAPAWCSSARSTRRSLRRTAQIGRCSNEQEQQFERPSRWIMTRKMFGVVIAVVLGAIRHVRARLVRAGRRGPSRGGRADGRGDRRLRPGGQPARRRGPGPRHRGRARAAGARGEQAITSLREVNGLVTTTELVPGEVLLRPRFANPGAVTKGVECGEGAAWTRGVTLSLEPAARSAA